MNHPQTIARVFGVLYLITFVTSIPAFFFYAPVLDDPRYILGGGGGDTSVAFGAFLELLLIIANIATAVVPFPILRRQNEILALGYVTARIVECAFIAVGLLSLLTVVTLRQEAAAGADAGSLVAVGESLVALHNWTRLLGPGFVVGIGNGLILGYLMYSSRLAPRGMAVLGLIGGPLIIASGVAVLIGVIEAGSVWQAIATIPEFFWELSLGIWLTVRGFNPSVIASEKFRLRPAQA
jgi:branched-subunit amino acid transport protein AzlD